MADRGMTTEARDPVHRASRRARVHWHGSLYAVTAVLSLYAICDWVLGGVTPQYQVLMLLAGILSYAVLGRHDLEADWRWNQGTGQGVLAGWFGILTLLLLLGFSAGVLDRFSRSVTLSWASTYPLLMFGIHCLLRVRARAQGTASRRRAIAVLGGASEPTSLNALFRSPLFHWLGVFSAPGIDGPVPLLGGVQDVAAYLRRERPDAVFLCLPLAPALDVAALLEVLREQEPALYLIPLAGMDPPAGDFEVIEGITVLRLSGAALSPLAGEPELGTPLVRSP